MPNTDKQVAAAQQPRPATLLCPWQPSTGASGLCPWLPTQIPGISIVLPAVSALRAELPQPAFLLMSYQKLHHLSSTRVCFVHFKRCSDCQPADLGSRGVPLFGGAVPWRGLPGVLGSLDLILAFSRPPLGVAKNHDRSSASF